MPIDRDTMTDKTCAKYFNYDTTNGNGCWMKLKSSTDLDLVQINDISYAYYPAGTPLSGKESVISSGTYCLYDPDPSSIIDCNEPCKDAIHCGTKPCNAPSIQLGYNGMYTVSLTVQQTEDNASLNSALSYASPFECPSSDDVFENMYG